MYILDTSAIRGISSANLKLAATKFDIAVPTVSVLELASHLNDSPNDDDYSRARGNLVKCKMAQILDDPFWLLSQRIQSSANPTRKEDRAVLGQLIAAAEQSQTLAELETKILSYPDGAIASCRDIGKGIGKILKEEEDSFVAHIKSLPALAKLDLSLNGKHCLSSAEFLEQLLAATLSLSGTSDKDVQIRTFLATAPYFGYLIHRMYQYANRLQPGAAELLVDQNDCEDAYTSLCLDLHGEDILVTNDRGTLAALRNTFTLLNEVIPLSIDSYRVMSNEEFLHAIEP
ncbi:hypothetical protein [Achromobacter sp. 413638]|uniref:hypothetical protein n=1 Tax=Achromobacter sp. 413638 TaxID=3342385 RepID=UPI00370BF80B